MDQRKIYGGAKGGGKSHRGMLGMAKFHAAKLDQALAALNLYLAGTPAEILRKLEELQPEAKTGGDQ